MKIFKTLSPSNHSARNFVVYFGFFLLLLSFVVAEREGYAAEDLNYMVEDFEGSFTDESGYGSIPSDWYIVDIPTNEVVYSKDTDSHHGQYSLRAEVRHDPVFYTIIRTTLVGEPNIICNLQIQAKAETSGKAYAVLDASYNGNIYETARYWYNDTSSDWFSMTLEEVEFPSSGRLVVDLKMVHDTISGQTDFNFDCLTSDVSFFDEGETENATVSGTLQLPAEANGMPYLVAVDTDTEYDNDCVAETFGICGPGMAVDYSINDVPAGTYYVYAVVFVVSQTGPPQDGDYIGFYETGMGVPPQPNAVVPTSGVVTFDIYLDILGIQTPEQLPDGSDNSSGGGGGGGGCFLNNLLCASGKPGWNR